MDVYDYIIVGAGIEGSATAYYLAKHGHKILLLEQYSLRHANGSSHGGSRITRKLYDKPFYAKMMIEGEKAWLDLEREYGEQIFLKTGMLLVAPESSPIMKKYKTIKDDYHIPTIVLKGTEIHEKFPALSEMPVWWEALFEPDAGILKADKCLEAYHFLFTKYGGTLKEKEKVINLIPKSDSVEIHVEKGGKYFCKSIVLCLGPWTGRFLKTYLNLALPLKAVSTTVCYWKELKDGVYSAVNGFPPVWILSDDTNAEYPGGLIPSLEFPGLVKICCDNKHPVDLDHRDGLTAEDSKATEKASKIVQTYFPEADFSRPALIQSCLYTMTPDHHIILDHHPIHRNVIIGAGFSGHGFKLAPVVGRILGSLAIRAHIPECNLVKEYDLSEVSINRFLDK